eukprot:8383079-Prorocentrum_lima.AAC.1
MANNSPPPEPDSLQSSSTSAASDGKMSLIRPPTDAPVETPISSPFSHKGGTQPLLTSGTLPETHTTEPEDRRKLDLELVVARIQRRHVSPATC